MKGIKEVLTVTGESIRRFGGKTVLWTKRNSPELLTAGGIIMSAVAIVLACKATTKLDEKVKPHNEKIDAIKNAIKKEEEEQKGLYPVEQGKQDLTKEYVKTAWEITKLYAPSAITFTLSVASILSSHKIMKGRNVALAAAYSTMQDAFNKYRQRVADKIGEEAEKDVYNNVQKATEKVINDDGDGSSSEEETTKANKEDNPWVYLFDQANPNWNKNGGLNLDFLLMTERYMNQKLKVQGYLFMSDVYDALCIPENQLTDKQLQGSRVVGWIYDPDDKTRDNYVSFGLTDEHGILNHDAMDLKRHWESNIWLEFNPDGDILTGNNGQKIFVAGSRRKQ